MGDCICEVVQYGDGVVLVLDRLVQVPIGDVLVLSPVPKDIECQLHRACIGDLSPDCLFCSFLFLFFFVFFFQS